MDVLASSAQEIEDRIHLISFEVFPLSNLLEQCQNMKNDFTVA